MNIEQVKADLDNNVIVSRQTWHKLVEAALMMQEAIQKVAKGDYYWEGEMVLNLEVVLAKVEAL